MINSILKYIPQFRGMRFSGILAGISRFEGLGLSFPSGSAGFRV